MNLNGFFFYGTKSYIPKAKRKTKKLYMNKITLESPLDCHEVQDTDTASLVKSSISVILF